MAAFNVFLIVYFFFQLRLNTEHFEGKNWPRTFIFYQNLLQTCLKHSVEKKTMAGLCERVLWLLCYQLLSVKTATQTWPTSVVNGQDNSISEISPYYQGRWFYQHWLGGQWFLLYNKLSNLPKSATHSINQVFNKILRTFVANRLRHNQGKKKKSKEFGTITQPF